MNFQSCGGVPLQIYGPLNIIIRTAPRFWRWPPLNFRSLLRENDRDYDAQNFRIFISHHYLPPHLKRKKSMTCCGAHPRCWHGIALLQIGRVIDDDLIYTPTEGKFIYFFTVQWAIAFENAYFSALLVTFDLIWPTSQEKLRKSLCRGTIGVILYLSELV